MTARAGEVPTGSRKKGRSNTPKPFKMPKPKSMRAAPKPVSRGTKKVAGVAYGAGAAMSRAAGISKRSVWPKPATPKKRNPRGRA